jgi:cell division septation protein DedD
VDETRSQRRHARRAGPGWLATALGALLLVAAGFAIGLVAGAAFEEPDLVLAHLAGRTAEAPLRAEEPEPAFELAAPAAPPEAIPAPEPRARPLGAPRTQAVEPPTARPAGAAPAPPPAAPPVAAPPPVSTPAAREPREGSFSVQVGAFAEEPAARELAQGLRGKGFEATIVREGSGVAPFKVRVGPVASRPEAERLASRLQREQRLPTWVLALDGR